MIELKPCPFCGGKAHVEKNFDETYRFYHTCKNTQINIYKTGFKTRKEAIEAWNRRADNGQSNH